LRSVLKEISENSYNNYVKIKTICDDEENFIHNVYDQRRIPDYGTGAGCDDYHW